MNKTGQTPIRIGRIDFTNVWPVFHYFPEGRWGDQVQIERQVPSGLNRAMAEGRIDLGAISSYSYAEHADEYLLLPNLSVCALGRVNSIFLFHRGPLEELREGLVATASTSASSVNLFRIIMRRFLNGSPREVSMQPDLNKMMEEADAALLIGDDAIKASWMNERDGLYRMTDLGELWKQFTGQWMVFAVWALRKEAAAANPELVEDIYGALIESKRKSVNDIGPLVDKAVHSIGGTEAFWHAYFHGLQYGFGEPQQEGLLTYYRYAWEEGLLERQTTLNFWRPGEPSRTEGER
ncbi:ABC transporter substrate-binding protein [Xylanibacillus composti]|uniref:Chorismate dehydratase n=1 Tax=Xylanibacillus composti TaxID=1572762 RepID=A0A8J4H2J4_9BACL|nr:menaquinone biosynthesis protein [Xylanibacillus composti]MDT9725459.1 ABC transporter substrate-binding protein [Xylanibacillus composti]GIQ67553.1 chorismate dehydratase [Xylanibacillus composti]